jgi:hypothetical protein
LVRLTPASQILDRGSSATHSSHAATQRANISLIDRRSRWPRRVPYLAPGFLIRSPRTVGRVNSSPLTKKAISTFAATGARPRWLTEIRRFPRVRVRCGVSHPMHSLWRCHPIPRQRRPYRATRSKAFAFITGFVSGDTKNLRKLRAAGTSLASGATPPTKTVQFWIS